MSNFYNGDNWFAVNVRPTLWWRIKAVFKCPDIWFCASDKSWMMNGFEGETYTVVNSVPMFMRHRIAQSAKGEG